MEFNLSFSNSNKRGTVSFNAKHDKKYYERYRILHNNRIGCEEEICIKAFRYLNWSDITGFLPSSAFNIVALSRKKPRVYLDRPRVFDHTTFWRKPGERFPLFCITEPYGHLTETDLQIFHDYAKKYNIDYKIYNPSKKSLWNPPTTYMIFLWDKNYFNFYDHESILFSHVDCDEFEKECHVKYFNLNNEKNK